MSRDILDAVRDAAIARDSRGSVSIVFALSCICVLVFVACAIDVGYALRLRQKAQSAADAAALSAVATARAYIASQSSQGTQTLATAATMAQAKAQTIFATDLTGLRDFSPTATVTLNISNGVLQATTDYTGTFKTFFGGVIGKKMMTLAGSAAASLKLPPYVNVYLLVDTSGSMALGASSGDQAALIGKTGCAFACHDGNPIGGYADAFAMAKASGIMLRIDAIDLGVLKLMDTIDGTDPGHQFVSTAVYSFNNNLTQNSSLTTDTASARWNLPTTPATSSMTAGATHFNEVISQVVSDIGNGGDGSTPDQAIKLLIIATDGAEDPGRYWVTDAAARSQVAPFDMSFCSDLKNNGVNVGVIHTPYLPMTYDWGYMATLGQPSQIGGNGSRADDIPVVLQQCAGSRYVKADDATSIANAFTTIFQSLNVVRLTQ